ncbi:zinc finger protein 423-like [Ptychodera flava]|uniref:zinc finger protein 423-like n=1 Tax=Ptychodera flava TaxID=63121 RepID=UPI00396A0C26
MDSVEVCEEIYEALLQCAICQSRLTQPKVLPHCSHVFCRECLESMLRASSGILLCPTCRADNTSAVRRRGVNSLVDGHFINKLEEIVNRHRNGSGNAQQRILFSSTRHGSTPEGLAGASDIRSAGQGFNRQIPSQYECPVCSMQFHDLDLLQSHAEMCTDDQYNWFFTCPNCGNMYPNDIFAIQAHLVGCMPDVSIIGDADPQYRVRADARDRHRMNDHDWFMYMCPSCDATYDDMASMEAHVAIHHRQESLAQRQTSREGEAGRSPSIQGSLHSSHATVSYLASASQIQQRSENATSDSNSHLYGSIFRSGSLERGDARERHRENGLEWCMYMCPSCDATYNDMASMEDHVAIHHRQESLAQRQTSWEGQAGRSPSIHGSLNASDAAVNNLAGTSQIEQRRGNVQSTSDSPSHLSGPISRTGSLEASDINLEFGQGHYRPAEPSFSRRTLQNGQGPTSTSRFESEWTQRFEKCIIL